MDVMFFLLWVQAMESLVVAAFHLNIFLEGTGNVMELQVTESLAGGLAQGELEAT